MPDGDFSLAELSVEFKNLQTSWEAHQATQAEQLAELKSQGVADPLLQQKLEKIEADLTRHGAVVDEHARKLRERSVFVDGEKSTMEDLEAKAADFALYTSQYFGRVAQPHTAAEQKEYAKSMRNYMRLKDERQISPEDYKSLSVGSAPDGGYFVDADTNGRMVSKIFETSPIRSYASTQVISSNALEGMYDLEEPGSGWGSETEAVGETATAGVGRWSIPVHEQRAMPKITQKLIEDASVDVVAWHQGKVVRKFARDENYAFTVGTGNDRPRGFTTYAHGTSTTKEIEQIPSGAGGSFKADPDGFDAFIRMITALKAEYRANATWAMNRTTAGEARLLKDSDGRYLWQPPVQLGQPGTLFGYPVASFEDMADITTANALAVAFGDFAEAYMIVDRLGISVLIDPYTAKPFIQYYTRKRTGGDVVNFEAIKLMKSATSV